MPTQKQTFRAPHVARKHSLGHRRRMAAAVALAAMTVPVMAGTVHARTVSHVAGGKAHEVGRVAYDLGDSAYKDPDYPDVPMELTGVVHYPKDLKSRPHPMVVAVHGLSSTCTNGHTATTAWPCPAGTTSIPNYRGYDYLGEELARQGYVVLSIGANGVNAHLQGDDDAQARADLINKHLALWMDQSEKGASELTGKFTGGATNVDFRNSIDFTRVGTLGHSRGGRAVMRHATDEHRHEWPAGAHIKAVLGYAPVYPWVGDPATVTGAAVGIIDGTCDGDTGTEGTNYFTDAHGKNANGLHEFTVHGANHNFFNALWSPSSGLPSARDDASRIDHQGNQLPAGRCISGRSNTQLDRSDVTYRQLTEEQQREVGAAYASAFFQRYLGGQSTYDAILTGKKQPMSGITQVDVRAEASAGAGHASTARR
ncbi:alpha/beta hydrolase [Streptomyces sp. NPDC055709]